MKATDNTYLADSVVRDTATTVEVFLGDARMLQALDAVEQIADGWLVQADYARRTITVTTSYVAARDVFLRLVAARR